MRVKAFYRVMVWVPIVLPGAVFTLTRTVGWPQEEALKEVVRLLVVSFLLGGAPYLPLAIWATWWIPQHTEPEIRRRALRAPLMMLAAWAVIPVYAGIVAREIEVTLGYALLGGGAILILGYGYVALTFALRRLVFGPPIVAA